MPSFAENQEREDQFLYQLGRTLANWQTVEHDCYQLYFKIMKGIDPHLISVNWHHIQSFDTRLTLLNQCAHFAFSEATFANWKPLRLRVERASKIRNAIVHGSFGIEFHKGIGTPSLHQSYMDATAIVKGRVQKNKLRPEFRFELERLEKHSEEFKSLALDVRQFAKTTVTNGAKGG